MRKTKVNDTVGNTAGNFGSYAKRLIFASLLLFCWIWLLILFVETVPDSQIRIFHPATEPSQEID